jgi:hypothetical protein
VAAEAGATDSEDPASRATRVVMVEKNFFIGWLPESFLEFMALSSHLDGRFSNYFLEVIDSLSRQISLRELALIDSVYEALSTVSNVASICTHRPELDLTGNLI